MTKIFFTNKQYAKLKELVYLGTWMRNALHVPGDEYYDEETNKLSDYIDSFAKDHDMKKYLNGNGDFSDDYEEQMHGYIESYNDEIMLDELIEKLAYRDFYNDHLRDPIFDLENPAIDEYGKFDEYQDKYDEEFEKNGVKNLYIK